MIDTHTKETCPFCGDAGKAVGVCHHEEVFCCRCCQGLFFKRAVLDARFRQHKPWYADYRDRTKETADTLLAMMRPAYEKQLDVLETLVPGKRILDFGCGLGVFLEVARQRGWDVLGVDVSSDAAKFAERNFHVRYLSRLDTLSDSSMDVVRVSHVLEHCVDIEALLVQFARVLSPRGILMITVPHGESFCSFITNRVRRIFSSKPKYSCCLHPDGHIWGFTAQALLSLTRTCGFLPTRIFTVSMGDRTYYPFFYDGLLYRRPWASLTPGLIVRQILPQIIDTIGNCAQRGSWVVGYFHKA